MTVVPRRPKRNALPAAGAVACSAAVAFGITSPQAADPRLDPADDSLESAAALLAAANTGGTVSTKAQRTFDRAITAIADIRNAREEIVEAQEAVDDPWWCARGRRRVPAPWPSALLSQWPPASSSAPA